MKSSIDEIRRRFDADVERFSNLTTGQQTTVDSDLALHMIEEGIVRTNPDAQRILDIGCGAGNFTLRVLARIPGISCSLIDVSRPMLDRAAERIGEAGGTVELVTQADIRETPLEREHYDVVVAAAMVRAGFAAVDVVHKNSMFAGVSGVR